MITWDVAVENFKAYLTLEKSLSKNSIQAYLRDVQKLMLFCQDQDAVAPHEVTYSCLNSYINFLNRQQITPRSQARAISSIKAFFKFLVYDEVITRSPASNLEAPKILKSLPHVLSIEEIEAMIEAVDLNKPEGQRNKAIIETLYSCGVRVSELITLRLSHVHFRTGFIKVDGKGNKERLIPLGGKAKDEIRLYLKSSREKVKPAKGYEDILFLNKHGKGLSRVMIFNIIKDLALRAGITKTVSPHTLRHSFASHMVNGGADIRAVQDMLGHESILTTEIYTHIDNTFLRDTMMTYHPRAKKS